VNIKTNAAANPGAFTRCLLGAGVLACALAAITGCTKKKTQPGDGEGVGAGPAAPAKLVKLAFVTNNTSEFWKIAAAGVHKYEKEGKVQVDIKLPPNGTPEDQNQILQNLSSQGYDSIAVSVIAPNDQTGVLDKIAEKSQLITFDSDAAKSKRLLYIGTNNYQAGRALGQEIVKLLPKGGKIAVFVGTFSADNAAQVVGLYNYNGTAIAAALEGLGKKGKVLAAVFDEDDGTLDGIAAGSIQVTVVQKPFQFGYLASKWMHELATNPAAAKASLPADRVIDTGVDIINKENVAAFRAQLAEMKK
jgi:ribose transport system substrate-binding protein